MTSGALRDGSVGGPPLDIYCDRLTIASAIAALRLRPSGGRARLLVLDGVGDTRLGGVLSWLLRRTGFVVEDTSFHAGRVRGDDGEAACLAAYRVASELSYQVADRLLDRAPLLGALNARAERNSIRLYVARALWHPLQEYIVRILIARELAKPSTGYCLLLRRPHLFDEASLTAAAAHTPLHFYRSYHAVKLLKLVRAAAWVVGRPLWRRIAGAVHRWLGRRFPEDPSRQALLLVQEDDLSLDSSYRVQPHWLFSEDARPEFDTYVIEGSARLFEQPDPQQLGGRGIRLLDERALSAMPLQPSHRQVHDEMRAAARACLAATRRHWSSPASFPLLDTAILFSRAAELVTLCGALQVRVFAAAESYMRDVEAMHLIAPALGIRTVAFQYSNLTLSNPVMMTTADTMAVFSGLYHNVWSGPGVRPGEFVSVGYLFDRRFQLLRVRAAALRQQLARAGARFVVCYFDESIQYDRYGLLSADDHRRELLALLRWVVETPDIGLIVKSQFERNSPARLYSDEPLLRAAAATGRYVELTHGRHRNNVLPAEAAMAADIAIGHCVGATAALEAALAGTRAVLLNPYGMRLLHDGLYNEADVLYDSMEAALLAVQAYRAGDPNHLALGDWSPILPHFDPFRDGKAAARFRRILEGAAGIDHVDAVDPPELVNRRPVLSSPAGG